MDKPVYRELREITRHGTQTLIDTSLGVVTGDFYAVEFFNDLTQIRTITIDNQVDPTALIGVQIFDRDSCGTVTLYNVQSIELEPAGTAVNGLCIAYTAPALTGQIEP
tara:strand:+ start:511 stop:834 length:324 start_codon:yes stop_codon:yes gene_type:complete